MVLTHNGTWKTIAITLLGMVGTGIGAWLVLGRDTIHRVEFNELRSELTQSIDQLDDTVHGLSAALAHLNGLLEGRANETR